jgi:translation initiation factor 2 alpha subunit (eIF-2alpha)
VTAQVIEWKKPLDRYSLLAHVAPSLTSQLENLATEALLYLLRRYEAAKDAFADFVSETGHAAADDLAFGSQVRMGQGSGRIGCRSGRLGP